MKRHHTVHRTLSAAMGSLILVAGVTGIAVAAGSEPAPGSDQSSTTVEDTGVDSGPDADATEPGHQDADESADVEEANGAEEADGADEADGAGTDVNSGPDANPNEPGHQDADESGEAQD